MQRANEAAHARQDLICGRPRLDRIAGDGSVDEAEHVATLLVTAEIARRAVEADAFEVVQVGRDGRAGGLVGAADGTADAHHALGDVAGG